MCRDFALVPGAVAESLRYEPAVASFMRVTLEDIDLDGCVVPRDRMVSLSTLAAMRDPAVYSDPDTFDIRRADQSRRHLVFGRGAHRCLGEVLAMVELEEGLAALTPAPSRYATRGRAAAHSWQRRHPRTIDDMRVRVVEARQRVSVRPR